MSKVTTICFSPTDVKGEWKVSVHEREPYYTILQSAMAFTVDEFCQVKVIKNREGRQSLDGVIGVLVDSIESEPKNLSAAVTGMFGVTANKSGPLYVKPNY